MNDRRSWAERLSAGHTTSTARPPSSRPEPGPGGPVRSNGPERTPAPGPGPRARPPVPDPEGPALRVVLVSRDNMLAGALRSLIVAPGGVRMLDWYSGELDAAIRHADVVIVDMPPTLHERTFAVIGGRFLGRTVVLLQEGEHAEALPPGPSRAVLYRPLQIGELWAAVTGTLPPVGTAPEQASAEEAEKRPQPDAEGPGDQAAAVVEGEGLPVAESGLLIGLSGRELEPVVGPGQVAPGMDEATFERLRRWGTRGRQPATAKPGTPLVRRAGRAAAGLAKAAEARRERSRQQRAVRASSRQAARADAARARAARAEARTTAREESRQARAARAQQRQAARHQSRQARAEARRVAAEASHQARAAKAAARAAAQEAARKAEAAKAAERAVAQEAARQARAAEDAARAAARAEARAAQAAQAKARRAERAEARRVAREGSRQARTARAEARQVARAEAGRRRAAWAEGRRAAREEARQARAARVEVRRRGWAAKGAATAARAGELAGGAAQGALIVAVTAAVGVAAAGWHGDGGPDTLAGEVAVVRAAEGSGGGLAVQDPRIGPIEPLHALAAGAWLRATEAGTSLEAAVRDARMPGRFLLAAVVALTMLLFLLLMRVGPGTGAAAGPGPAPPQARQRDGRDRRRRLGGAAVTGALVALDPLMVRNGRVATGTILAVLLALGALALAWGLPARPTLRRQPLVAAAGGLALLVSPLALPVLAVPVVAELLEGRYREAWREMAAVVLAAGLWLVLPIWVAGQDLGAGQAGWLLGRPPGRGSVAASLAGAPLSWLLVAAGPVVAALAWRHRSGARPGPGARPLAWTATTAAGALVAIVLGFPAGQALAFATPAAAVSLVLAFGVVPRWAGGVRGTAGVVPRWIELGAGVALAGLLVAQGVDWSSRYGRSADDGLGRLVATVATQVPPCSAVNAGGPDDRARLLAAGVTVTEFSNGPAAQAAGVRYFVLTGTTSEGGPMTPSLAGWVRQHGNRLAAHPSSSLSGVELWHVDAAPLDPVADNLPVPDGVFSNVDGSACGGYRVVDSQAGAFHTAYQDVGGKAVLGRPLGSVWTSDGPALQAFDTMVLGAVPSSGGPPTVRPIELPPLLAKLDVQAVAKADIPLPSARPPVTDRQARALLGDKLIARAYLGTDPATASPEDWQRARSRFGRPLGMPQTMPDGAVRQPFERVVLELPADGGPARPAALGRLAVRLGLVPRQAMRLEPVPGLPASPAETRLDPGPLLRSLGTLLSLLLLAAAAGAVAARRSRTAAGNDAGGR
jgi:colicin import membrane protein